MAGTHSSSAQEMLNLQNPSIVISILCWAWLTRSHTHCASGQLLCSSTASGRACLVRLPATAMMVLQSGCWWRGSAGSWLWKQLRRVCELQLVLFLLTPPLLISRAFQIPLRQSSTAWSQAKSIQA